eukprot:CAMPEP_0202464036 /NCGR_PEP_ID=MMETSP1360-20130828/60502_1 /ASSEMBLY_ACC=CAM_ASM_000848 /TAXON_ID=515479 /ORGANISM="Licmophora paradoxa, Strain CCMP2313" /LENGTH=339 /DNA_ID=CAMNT_0049087161 /DNA_START=101 /DNA_END=1120 /DNA_ORIENTATION=-
MPLAIPPELKKITPFVRRAEELDKDKANAESRLVAYYCRQYAVHAGIPLAQSPASKECLGSLLNDLETEKQPMSNFTKDESKYLCTDFANRIFEKADEEDQSGNASKNTAKTFYAAASFLEILNQFYAGDDTSEELAELKKRTKYSKWKATDIIKAIKEGRQPTAGGYKEYEAEPDEQEAESTPPSLISPLPSVPPTAPSMMPPPPLPPAVETVTEEEGQEVPLGGEKNLNLPPPAYPGPPHVFVPPMPSPPPSSIPKPPIVPTVAPTPDPMPSPPRPQPAKKPSFFNGMRKKRSDGKTTKEQFADAIELTNFALAALNEKDDDLAAQRLKQALQALGK